MDYAKLRKLMVESQLKARGVVDERVLNAFLTVPREMFVPKEYRHAAYDDRPLPIGFGQTISQPFMVAKMTELLELCDDDILLEIGTGSGYQAAIASKLCKFVYSVERIKELAEFAKENLARAGIKNVNIFLGDGTLGLPEFAPYDKIIITAATEKVPEKIFNQLKIGGILVVPEGSKYVQTLVRYRKIDDKSFDKENYFECVFVPLIGEKGFDS